MPTVLTFFFLTSCTYYVSHPTSKDLFCLTAQNETHDSGLVHLGPRLHEHLDALVRAHLSSDEERGGAIRAAGGADEDAYIASEMKEGTFLG